MSDLRDPGEIAREILEASDGEPGAIRISEALDSYASQVVALFGNMLIEKLRERERWLTKEAHSGGDWDHLTTRAQEAAHIAGIIGRSLTDAARGGL